MTVTDATRQLIKEQYKKCAFDPRYFLIKYSVIQHPTRGKIPFILYPFQEDTLENFRKHRFNIILKSRQLGLSTLVAGYICWMMTFHEDKNILVIAMKQDVAKNLVTKVRIMNQNLPSWIRVPAKENNKLSLVLENGSQVKCTSSSGDAGRSEALSLLVLDECALINKISDIWISSQQTLATGGDCIVLSTPNGVGNWFHKMYTKAEGGEVDLSSDVRFNPIRLPWSVHPERDQQWRDEQTELLGAKNAAQECFDGNTRVVTRYGYVPIRDIRNGDYVLTHRGRFRKVTRKFTKKTSETICFHSDRNYKKSYVTVNHPFLVDEDSGVWKEIGEIENKSVLYHFCSEVEWVNGNEVVLDLYEITQPKYFKKTLFGENKFHINDRRHKKIYPRFLKVDYEFGYLIGLYLAEGSGSRLAKTFSFNYDVELNTWPQKLIEIVSKKFGIVHYHISNSGSSGGLIFNSEVFCYVIDLFCQGNRAYKKKLTPFAYENATIDFFRGVLDGVMLGDGMVNTKYNKSILTTSKNLLYDIKFISNLLGLYQSSFRPPLDHKTRISYFDGRRVNVHPRYVLSFLMSKRHDVEVISELLTEKWTNESKIKINGVVSEEIEVFNLEVEEDHSYITEHFVVHNCDCDFLTSGDSLVDSSIIKFYEETYVKPPLEKRGVDHNFWIWEYPNYSTDYIVCADVSRGDGKDFSGAHVLDIQNLRQVAEYKGLVDTKTFGDMLVSIATDYNDALLIIEREGIGWATIQQVIDRNYMNLFYSSSDLKYVDTLKNFNNKIYSEEKKMIPGFATTQRTRPLIISKIESVFREGAHGDGVVVHSKRLIDELYTFIWRGNRVEAMAGYHDDLCMAMGIGLWVRDTAMRLRQEGIELTKKTLVGIGQASTPSIYQPGVYMNDNPYHMIVGNGEIENLETWMGSETCRRKGVGDNDT